MCRIQCNIAAKEVSQQSLMIPSRIEMALPVIGAHEKASRSAGRIKDGVIAMMDAKRIDQVDRVVASKVLSVAMALLRPDEFLENTTDDIRRYVAKVN